MTEAIVEPARTRDECPECGQLATLATCTACDESGDPLLRAHRICLTCFLANHEAGKCRL